MDVKMTGRDVARNAARFQKVLGALQRALPTKGKRTRAIGEVAALVTALAFVVLGIFGLDFGRAS